MTNPRATVIVAQRERFDMTARSGESRIEATPDAPVIHVDDNLPARQTHDIGLVVAGRDSWSSCDNEMLVRRGWEDRLVTCADMAAPSICRGRPAHTEVRHAGGNYAPGGDRTGFFANVPELGRAFEEV